ncbi:430_t:CDS:2, partial [Entrophospora sp. SA101]
QESEISNGESFIKDIRNENQIQWNTSNVISSVEETGRVIVEADDVDYSDDNESNNAMIVSPDDNDGINDGNADGSRSDVN